MRSPGFYFNLIFLTAAASSLHGVTTIKEDTRGVILVKSAADATRLDSPIPFVRLYRDQVHVNIQTPDSLVIHILTERVVKIVYFLKPDTFPTKFMAEDLAVIHAKIDELKALEALAPQTERLCALHLKYLQNVYEPESANYKQSVADAWQKLNADDEKKAFDKKCELMRLDLMANRDNIQRSEEIVKEMEPFVPHSENLFQVLAKWNSEKKRVLELADECKQFWKATLSAHPECFATIHQLQDMPAFPTDMKMKAAGLQEQLDQFRKSVTYSQVLAYCQPEIPAYFLLNQLAKLVEDVKVRKFDEAVALAQKTLNQVEERQIVDPYVPIYTTFKNYSGLAEDLKSQFLRQLAKAKHAEDDSTNQELLVEYQKAYDLIPDPKVAAKIEELKRKISKQ